MATITVNEWHPDVGSIWARMVALWEAYVVDTTLTWAFTTATVSTHRVARVTITGAVDTNVYNLTDGATGSTNVQPVIFVQSRPGWMYFPKVLEVTYGARTTTTDWTANMQAARRSIWSLWTSCAFTADTTLAYSLNGLGGVATWAWFTVRSESTLLIDWSVVTVKAQTATDYFFQSRPISTGQLAPSAVVLSTGGGSTDLSGVVTALQDIAHQDIVTAVDNGMVVVLQKSGDTIP